MKERYKFTRVIYEMDMDMIRKELKSLKKYVKKVESRKIRKKIKKRIKSLEFEISMEKSMSESIKVTEILLYDMKKKMYYKVDKNFRLLLLFSILSFLKKKNFIENKNICFKVNLSIYLSKRDNIDYVLELLYKTYLKKVLNLDNESLFQILLKDDEDGIILNTFDIGEKDSLKEIERIINNVIKLKRGIELDMKKIKLKKFKTYNKKKIEYFSL